MEGFSEDIKKIQRYGQTERKTVLVIEFGEPRKSQEPPVIRGHRYVSKGIFNISFDYDGVSARLFYYRDNLVEYNVLDIRALLGDAVVDRISKRVRQMVYPLKPSIVLFNKAKRGGDKRVNVINQ